MKVAYIAGPYRSKNQVDVRNNITAARKVGVQVCKKGYSVIIPHSNTGLFDFALPSTPDRFWLDATMELLKRSDLIVLCPGYKASAGTLAEIKEAEKRGLPIYEDVRDLPECCDCD